MEGKDELLVIGKNDIERILSMPVCIDLMEKVFKGSSLS